MNMGRYRDVKIDGNSFEEGDRFPPSAKVVITYCEIEGLQKQREEKLLRLRIIVNWHTFYQAKMSLIRRYRSLQINMQER